LLKSVGYAQKKNQLLLVAAPWLQRESIEPYSVGKVNKPLETVTSPWGAQMRAPTPLNCVWDSCDSMYY
jgi:hypothetical protein